jgi:hypothetical protein
MGGPVEVVGWRASGAAAARSEAFPKAGRRPRSFTGFRSGGRNRQGGEGGSRGVLAPGAAPSLASSRTRRLKRLEPLPWANTINPCASSGMRKVPASPMGGTHTSTADFVLPRLVDHSSACLDQSAFVLAKSRHALCMRASTLADACACQPAIAAAAAPLSADSAPSPARSEAVAAMSL